MCKAVDVPQREAMLGVFKQLLAVPLKPHATDAMQHGCMEPELRQAFDAASKLPPSGEMPFVLAYGDEAVCWMSRAKMPCLSKTPKCAAQLLYRTACPVPPPGLSLPWLPDMPSPPPPTVQARKRLLTTGPRELQQRGCRTCKPSCWTPARGRLRWASRSPQANRQEGSSSSSRAPSQRRSYSRAQAAVRQVIRQAF